uniref:Uncharacterized protein n=1 Tax=Trichogramma kaykai TaxID=54128 RepID=A0ABD2WLM9_9HYME
MQAKEVATAPYELNNILIYKKTNWQKFKKALAQQTNFTLPIDKNLSNEEIDAGIQNLQSCIVDALSKSTPRGDQEQLGQLTGKNYYKDSANIFPTLNRFFRYKGNSNLNIKESLIKPEEHHLIHDLVNNTPLNPYNDTLITDLEIIPVAVSRFFSNINKKDPPRKYHKQELHGNLE